jgi:DNA polymerase alpha subunit A
LFGLVSCFNDTARRKKKAKKAKDSSTSTSKSKENADPSKLQKVKKKPPPPPRPVLANPYKKAITVDKEEDLMADIFGDLAAAPRSPSPPLKKRKAVPPTNGFSTTFRSASSSALATSSDPIVGDGSSFLETGPSSDGLDNLFNDATRSIKKPRVSGAERILDDLNLDNDHSFEANDLFDGGNDMDVTASNGKEEEQDDEMMVVQAVRKAKNPAGGKRQLVNTSSVKTAKPSSSLEASQEEQKPDIKPTQTLHKSKKPKGMDWKLAAEAVTLDDEIIEVADEQDVFIGSKGPRKFKAPSAGGGSLATAKVQALEEDGSIRFYWLDVTENQGVLTFIGKVLDKETKKYVSASVTVEGIDRNLFVLPRQGGVDGKRIFFEILRGSH